MQQMIFSLALLSMKNTAGYFWTRNLISSIEMVILHVNILIDFNQIKHKGSLRLSDHKEINIIIF
jgi:FtsH-binding integral membrane protein